MAQGGRWPGTSAQAVGRVGIQSESGICRILIWKPNRAQLGYAKSHDREIPTRVNFR